MKKIRVIFITLTVIWMSVVFLFSNQPSDESQNTSSFMTKKIAKVIYGSLLNDEEMEAKVQKLDPIIRKLAHYSLYAFRRFFDSFFCIYI